MAISQKRYIDITSGVGGTPVAGQRELICRVMTTNSLANTAPVLEFTSLDNVATVFATSTDEYKFAAKYFGYAGSATHGAAAPGTGAGANAPVPRRGRCGWCMPRNGW